MSNKILFVIPYLVMGGAERALSTITVYWPKDWQIDILTNSIVDQAYYYNANIISMGIDGERKTDSLLFQVKVFFKRIKYIKKLKKNENYCACVSFLDSANIANILSYDKKCKNIVSVRGNIKSASNEKWQYKYVVSPLVKLFYNKADKIVAVSEELVLELVDDFHLRSDKVVAIPNGYDVDEIRRLATEALEPGIQSNVSQRPTLFTAGRLTLPKYTWHLIRAMKRVVEQIPDAVLMIAGQGEMEDYLRALTHDLDLEDNVKFLGYISNVYKYSAYADIFILPSGREGFPNALAEAVCVGTPCIATDFHTGAREILAPELLSKSKDMSGLNMISDITECTYGILTPICSGIRYTAVQPLEEAEIKLADAIIRMLTDEKLRDHYHNQSLKRAETLSIDDAINKWINLIK